MSNRSDETYAPGRKVMVRPTGKRNAYWVARKAARDAGFTPRTVPLVSDPGEAQAPPDVAAFCRRMWAEMLEFEAGRTSRVGRAPVGTIAWMADLYQSDRDGPYPRNPVTAQGYDKSIAIIVETVGARRIDGVNGRDVREWFRKWGRADADGVLANPRRAYGCIQLLRIVMKYGKSLKNAACRDLADILSDMEFPVPRRRSVAMTLDQCLAIIGAAHETGDPEIALGLAFQFGCMLRQKDVIGEWLKDGTGRRWVTGLVWGRHISSDLVLTKPTSKSRGGQIAEHDLRLIPMVLGEIDRIPRENRIGPVIVDHRTGKPFLQREYARRFRHLAQRAGVPDSVWNMDARAGAITEAHEKGATIGDAMASATHTQAATNLGYRRSQIAATSRVAALRFGKRE